MAKGLQDHEDAGWLVIASERNLDGKLLFQSWAVAEIDEDAAKAIVLRLLKIGQSIRSCAPISLALMNTIVLKPGECREWKVFDNA